MKKGYWFFIVILCFTAACSGAQSTQTTTKQPTATNQPVATQVPSSTPAPFDPTVEIIGEQEVVFDWDIDRCGDDQLPDLPVRALRTADGEVMLFTSSTVNYRLIGSDFDSLTVDCNPVLQSDFDRDPANYNHSEWVGAVYTEDGQVVHAIIHQEYHGDQAGSRWDATVDFSGEQEGNHWRYKSWDGNNYFDMAYSASKEEWTGYQELCLINQYFMHPGTNCSPTRTWISPVSGTVGISGQVYDNDSRGGNGVTARILNGDQEIWSAEIENGDETGSNFEVETNVQVGDQIHFRVEAGGDAGWDTTFFKFGIDLGNPPCPSNRHDMCTLISLTHAVSTDGGATFTQSGAPDHLLANLPYQYDPEWMRSVWQPSNIVKHPGDGYYYALIQVDEHNSDYSRNTQVMCLIRTNSLDDPASWRAWDLEGFNMPFINPYTESDFDREEYTCAPVSPEVGAITYGLTYNTYLEKFVAIGVGFDGFYMTFSDDLIDWSHRKFIMTATQTFADGSEPPFMPYPTLIDHDSPSLSFDLTGQMPYLYFARMNQTRYAYDMDIIRVQLKFIK
jgi:hypothetical protein